MRCKSTAIGCNLQVKLTAVRLVGDGSEPNSRRHTFPEWRKLLKEMLHVCLTPIRPRMIATSASRRNGTAVANRILVRPFMVKLVLLLTGLVGETQLFAAVGDTSQALTISVTEFSIKIGDIELRKGPPQGKYRYISPAAAEKALGSVTEKYPAGRIIDYARPNVGIHLQEGIRGAEEGKIFKFQVYLEDDYDARSEKNSGKFNGHVKVEGVEIGPGTTFNSIRDQLKKKGYKITEQPDLSYAQRSGPWGQIQIFTAGASGKIGRVEVWCL
jgi:hypothetical protein